MTVNIERWAIPSVDRTQLTMEDSAIWARFGTDRKVQALEFFSQGADRSGYEAELRHQQRLKSGWYGHD